MEKWWWIFAVLVLQVFRGCTSQSQAPIILRLNTSSNSGILQKYFPRTGGGGTWLNFCYNTLQTDAAVLSVICQSLGFNSNSSQITAHAISSIRARTVYFNSLRCTGTETDLSQCTYFESIGSYCSEVLSITCPMCDGFQVRLSNGLDQHQGTVEICVNGSWHHTCPYSWGYTNSFVVCRELGFPASHPTDVSYFSNIMPSSSNLGIYFYQFDCYGNETSLGSCNRILRTSYCRDEYDIGYIPYINVWCHGDEVVVSNCTPGDIRLIGGKDRYEGVVQICKDGLWGSFGYSFINRWDSLNSRVACRQLGLLQGNSSRISIKTIEDSGATGPIYEPPSCSGSETRLEYCPFTNFGSYFYFNQYHSNDVAIRCHPTSNPVTTCINGDVRLVGGPSRGEGRLELCYNGVWGSMCGTSTSLQTSTVVCRQLGFHGTNHTLVYLYSFNQQLYGTATGPIYLDSISCRGYESNLFECQRNSYSMIGHHDCSRDIAIICDTQPPPPPCQEGSIRLTGGYTPTDGHAQFCVNAQWLSSCTTNWNSATSDAFCRQLLQRTNVASRVSSCCTRNRVLQSNASLSFSCRANTPATNLLQNCPYSLVTCSSAIIIQCYVRDYCSEDAMRLYGGTSSTNGVLQICREGVWGNINSYSWSTYEAVLACRQLGLPTQWAHADRYSDYSYDSAAPFFITNLNCRGNETNLFNCNHNEFSLSRAVNFNSNGPARIICQDNQTTGGHPPCDSGSLRLGNYTDDGRRLDGRIEVCAEGTWTTLCGTGGSSNYSSVVCKQILGEPASASYFNYNKDYGNTSLPVIDGLQCPRDSVNITQCTVSYQASQNGFCSHRYRLGVICERGFTYEVQISASPSPPYYIGQDIELSCSISPEPTVRRYIIWSFEYNYALFGTDEQSGNWSWTVSSDAYQSGIWVCTVHINDFIVTGTMEVTTNGILGSTRPMSSLSNLVGQIHTFEVEIAYRRPINALLYNLSWFYNDELIANSTDSLITNEGASLTTTLQEGIYEARYEGLSVLPYNSYCESNIVKILRRYTLMKPVKFFVNAEETRNEEPMIQLREMSTASRFPTFTGGANLRFYFEGQIPRSLNNDGVEIKIYHNSILRQDVTNYIKFPNGTIFGFIVVNNATLQDAGTYEANLVWNYRNPCYHYYSNLLHISISEGYYFYRGVIEELIVAKSYLKVSYADSLVHVFSTNTTSLSTRETARLSCHASLTFPQFTNIAITKNGILLAQSNQSPVSYLTSALQNPFGKYECIVNASGVQTVKELTIAERAHVVINVQLPTLVGCNDEQAFTQMVKNSLLSYLRRQCACDLDNNDIYNVELDCRSGYRVYIELFINYTNEDGEISASTLAQMLSGQTTQTDLRFDFAGSSASIVSTCDEPICTAVPSDSSTSTVAPIPPFTSSTLPPTTAASTTEATTTSPQTTTPETTTEAMTDASSSSGSSSATTTSTQRPVIPITCPPAVATTGSPQGSSAATASESATSTNTETRSETNPGSAPLAITQRVITQSVPATIQETDYSSTDSVTSDSDTATLDVTTPRSSSSTDNSTATNSDRVAGTTTDESDTELGNPGGQIEQLLPAPYLIGAFVAVFLGGALVSAMLTSCVCLLVMRSLRSKPNTKLNIPDYDYSGDMGFTDISDKTPITNIDEVVY